MAYESLAAHDVGMKAQQDRGDEEAAQPRADCAQVDGGRSTAGRGKRHAAVCHELGVSEAMYHRWRDQFGGLKAEDAKRLKDLERENSTLKRLLADAELEKAALKEIAKLLSPERRRAAVRHLQRGAGVSERFACRVTGQHRATQRHEAASTTP
jgi:putative transposase